MNDRIYVVTHKPFSLSKELKNKGYELITVGNQTKTNEGVSDADGIDNIAAKNANYCELTAVYWMWKNVKTSIKGFCHYRRYFTHDTLKYNEKKILSITEAINDLDDRTVIMPQKKYYNVSSKELYLRSGYIKDLETTRRVINEKYPDYLYEWDKMIKENNGYITNMMICQSSIFDKYCEWLFDILEEVEKRTDLSGYSKEEARIYGYLSERLLGVWIEHNNLKVKEYQSINPEKDSGLRFLAYRVSVKFGVYRIIKTILWKMRK